MGGKELNPIARTLGLLPVKIIGVPICIFLILYFDYIWFVGLIVNIEVLFVVIWNYFQYRKGIKRNGG